MGRACAASSSSSGPSVTSRPRSRIATRSQIRSTSARRWVEKTTVAILVDRLRAAPWTTDVAAGDDLVRVTVSDPVAAAAGILPLVVAAGVVLDSFERARPTLEDVFLELVGPATADDLDGRGFIRPREVSDR